MEKGDFIKLDYVGRLETGEIFDLTTEETAKKEGLYNPKTKYRPVPIIVGEGFMIKGIDKALLDMKVGEKKDIELSPEESFGQRNPKLVRTVPRTAFRQQNVEPKPGMIVDFSNLKGRIQSISSGRIRVDFNNPLAGKKLKYNLEIKEKIEKPLDKIKALLDFFGSEGPASVEDKEAKISAQLPKESRARLSKLILKYMEDIEKITFFESYERKDMKTEKNGKQENEKQ